MAGLDAQEKSIIRQYPIDSAKLDRIRAELSSLPMRSASLRDLVQSRESNEDVLNVLIELYGTLITFQAARHLAAREPESHSTVFFALKDLNPITGDVDATVNLLEHVINRDGDEAIWEAIFELLSRQSARDKRASPPKIAVDLLQSLRKDWSRDYFPDSLNALREQMRLCLVDKTPYYAKCLVFVQSSGMGKSRLADRFGESCPTINFVFRDTYNGYPPGDPEVLSLMLSQIPKPEKDAILASPAKNDHREPEAFSKRRVSIIWNHSLALGLLHASFEIFHEWLTNQKYSTLSLQDLAAIWHKLMAPGQPDDDADQDYRSTARKEFCEEVSKRAYNMAIALAQDRKWRELFNSEENSDVREALSGSYQLKAIEDTVQSLMTKLKSCENCHDPGIESLLVVVFDEASNLFRKSHPAKSDAGIYIAVNRILSCLRSFPIWFFALSTESKIEKLLPPEKKMIIVGEEDEELDYSNRNSARLFARNPDSTMRLFPPFVAFPLDIDDITRMQDPKTKKEECAKSLVEFSHIEHMKLFGRPLWSAYEGNDVNEIANLKLLGGRAKAFIPTEAYHVFAALSFRLSLDVCVDSFMALPLVRTAVASYMRVIVSVNKQTGFLHTVTPSEPILAKAAMEYLCEGANWTFSIATLSRHLLHQGLIEKGLKGELFSRLVLILAQDWVRQAQYLPTNQKPEFKSTFTVGEFLEALYEKEHHRAIQEIPAKILNGRANFTHFTSTRENLTPDVIPSLCHDLLRRSAALQLAPCQPPYDQLIPFYFGDETKPFRESDCGVILVQDKNKLEPTTPGQVFQETFSRVYPIEGVEKRWETWESIRQGKATKFVFGHTKNPILFLLFDMGVVEHKSTSAAVKVQVQVSRSKGKRVPEIWAVHSRGHSRSVFRCLELLDTNGAADAFFESVSENSGLPSEVAGRNRRFDRLGRDFRYADLLSGEAGETNSGEEAAGTGDGIADSHSTEMEGIETG